MLGIARVQQLIHCSCSFTCCGMGFIDEALALIPPDARSCMDSDIHAGPLLIAKRVLWGGIA
jgi:hypothetical protein